MLVDRGKKAGTRPGTVGSSSPAAAGERWTSERRSSDQGALFKEATSELRAGVRRRHRMAGLRKGLLEEEEAPRLPACPWQSLPTRQLTDSALGAQFSVEDLSSRAIE